MVVKMKNSLKEKLVQGKSVFGTWIMTSGLDTAEILAQVGADCIMIDIEHGSMDIETAGRMVSLIKPSGTTPLLRVAGNDINLIKRGLDTGAEGVMVPMVNTREEAENLVKYCKYPPAGVRGRGPGRAVLFGSGGGDPEYYAKANDEILVIVQIEHIEAVENVYDILSVPGIDIAFIGPMDLTLSMGLYGQTNHPEVLKSYERVVDACKKNNVVPGILTGTGGIKQHLDIGFRFLLGGIDSNILYTGAKAIVDEFQNLDGR